MSPPASVVKFKRQKRFSRRASQVYYRLMAKGIGFLPLRRNAIAGRLMSRLQPKLRSAALPVERGRWVIMPGEPSTWVFPFGLKEVSIQHHLLHLLKRADSFIDCGANLGWYSFLASQNHCVRSIVAVEPICQSVRSLKFMKRLNRIEKLLIVKGCVSDHNGKARFVLEPGKFSELGYVEELTGGQESQRFSHIQCYTLESILGMVDPSLNRICIKIDVEGHEEAVLGSLCKETLLKRVDSMIVEVHLYKFPRPGEGLERICTLLSPLGEVKFLLPPQGYSGYRRFWRRLSKRYPVSKMSKREIIDQAHQRSLSEVHVLVQRRRWLGGAPC